MESKIKAIIFDMNGVLAKGVELKHGTPTSHSFHVLISKKLGISLDTWLDAIDSSYSSSIEGNISENKTLTTISKNLNIPPKKIETEVIKIYRKLFHENKDLYQYAFSLKSKGYKIGILSDQWPLSKKAIYDSKKLN